MTVKIRICALALVCLLFPLSLFACGKRQEDDPTQTSVTTNPTEGSVTPDITGADDTAVPEIPDVPGKENATMITSKELLTLIRTGGLTENGDYAVTDGEGIVFDSDDNGKTYDLGGAHIRVGIPQGKAAIGVKRVKGLTLTNGHLSVYGGTAIDTTTARSITLSALHISGDAEYAFVLGGKEVTLSSSTVCPDTDGRIETAVNAAGDVVMITDCNLQKATVGVCCNATEWMIAENNLLTDCETAFDLKAHDSTVWYNTVTGGKTGVRAVFAKGEISAAMGEGYNLLVAQNKFSGAETSVQFEGISNSVILLNELENATVKNGVNVYVNENKISGKLELSGNNYMIANENKGTVNATGNENFNGNNVTDLSKREKVGVNEELLPHLNAEQFVGMKRKTEMRTAGKTSANLYAYLQEQWAEKEYAIVPPGAYFNAPMKFSDLSDKTVYAYGVLNEQVQSKDHALYFEHCANVTIKGLFIGNAIYPHTQGTVVTNNQTKKVLEFRPDPGYLADFSNIDNFGSKAQGFIFREGLLYPYMDFFYESKSYSTTTNLNTLEDCSAWPYALAGDRVAMRNGSGATGIRMEYCTKMKIEDVTVNSNSGFAEADTNNDVAPVLHRFALSAGPAPVLDGSQSYAGYEDILWTDTYGRLRSAKPLNTSCDATHSTNARVGVQMISGRFELMNDDGGNINAFYGMAESYDPATKTLTYATCNVNWYTLLPSDFRVGDTVQLYTINGKFVGQTTVTSATVKVKDSENVKECRYEIKLAEDITLPEGTVVSEKDVKYTSRDERDHIVAVQNLSASGSGFLLDNMLVHNSDSYGCRIKATGGTIRNCTFDHVTKGGLSLVPEFESWPECGYARNINILNNEFIGLGNNSTINESLDARGYHLPILIRFTGYDDSDKTFVNGNNSGSADRCLHRNIVIDGNVFEGSFSKYDISLSSVMGLRITNNTFLDADANSRRTEGGSPILLFSGNDVTIEGNTFPDGVTNPVENRGSSNGVSNVEGLVIRNNPAVKPSTGKENDSDELPVSWEN